MTPEMMFIASIILVVAFALRRHYRKGRKRKSGGCLDDVLFRWPDGTPYYVRDLLRSCEVKGITGSGKSSGSLAFLLASIIQHPKAVLLILAQKPEERDEFVALFKKFNKPLRVVEPGGKWMCNLIQDELNIGADDRALVELYVNQGESLQDGMSNSGGDAKFFRLLEDRILQMTFGALRMAGEDITPSNVQQFLATAPYTAQALSDPKFRESYHFLVMRAAANTRKSELDANDFASIQSFFNNEFVYLDEKPRSGALAGIQNTGYVFSTGQAWKTCSTENTCSPSCMDEGISVLVNFPTSLHGPTGKFIANGFKFKWEKYLLRRKWDPLGYFCVIVCDEFQESVTSYDSIFISQSRSHGGCLLTATQTVASELSRMGGGHASHHKVDALNSNYGLHIFHQSDPITAEAAVKLVGQRLEVIISGTPDDDRKLYDELMGRARMKHSFSQSYQDILKKPLLLGGLRTGGPANDNCVDGVVIRGEPFANGERYQVVAFKQPNR